MSSIPKSLKRGTLPEKFQNLTLPENFQTVTILTKSTRMHYTIFSTVFKLCQFYIMRRSMKLVLMSASKSSEFTTNSPSSRCPIFAQQVLAL